MSLSATKTMPSHTGCPLLTRQINAISGVLLAGHGGPLLDFFEDVENELLYRDHRTVAKAHTQNEKKA